MKRCLAPAILFLSLLCGSLAYAEHHGATPDSLAPAELIVERGRILEQLGAAAYHAAGQRGKGVKVAVLDTGFRGYRAHLGKSLPAQVLARSFRKDGNLEARDSEHGILCGEVIHAIAPEAELLFANWETEQPETFLAAVKWAKEQGARVVSCSVIMPSWSDCEGGGPVHRALSALVGGGQDKSDVLLFAAAGNTAQRHWSGLYQDDGKGRHLWTTEVIDNAVTPWGGERVSVEVCWRGEARYEVSVTDETLGRAAGDTSTAAGRALVRFTPEDGHSYSLRLRRVEGRAGEFHLVVLGGTLRHASARGSIPFPGDGPEVIAVGAVDAEGKRQAYSSCGPNSESPKPDLVAAVPFPSAWRTRAFSGTSAAAPQAAALAALLWGRNPDWTAAGVRQALVKAAKQLKDGHSVETGFGQVRLPAK